MSRHARLSRIHGCGIEKLCLRPPSVVTSRLLLRECRMSEVRLADGDGGSGANVVMHFLDISSPERNARTSPGVCSKTDENASSFCNILRKRVLENRRQRSSI